MSILLVLRVCVMDPLYHVRSSEFCLGSIGFCCSLWFEKVSEVSAPRSRQILGNLFYLYCRYLEDPNQEAFIRPWVWILWLFFGPVIASIVAQYYYYIAVRSLNLIAGLSILNTSNTVEIPSSIPGSSHSTYLRTYTACASQGRCNFSKYYPYQGERERWLQREVDVPRRQLSGSTFEFDDGRYGKFREWERLFGSL